MRDRERLYTVAVFAILAVAVCAIERGSATDIFVNNRTGEDSYSGHAPTFSGRNDGPVRTIRAGLRRARRGDRVILAPTRTPYHEELVLDGAHHGGSLRDPFVFEGNGAQLIGTQSTRPVDWQYLEKGVYGLVGPARTSGTLMLKGQQAPRVQTAMWANQPSLDAGSYALWQGRFFFRTAADKQIGDYDLADSRLSGAIVVYRASHVVIRNLNICGFSRDAVQIRGPSTAVSVENCRLSDNGLCGLRVYTNCQVRLHNCFVENNGKAGVTHGNYSDLALVSCKIQGSPEEIVGDATSRAARSGPAPKPLPPPATMAPEPAKPAKPPVPAKPKEEEEPEPPAKEKARKSFFD